MEIKPLSYIPRGDRVIVKRLERPAPEPGSMVIPGSQQKPFDEGIVFAVGPQIKDIEIGQQVCFVEYAGTEVEVDGEKYLSLRDVEIHGVRHGATTKRVPVITEVAGDPLTGRRPFTDFIYIEPGIPIPDGKPAQDLRDDEIKRRS